MSNRTVVALLWTAVLALALTGELVRAEPAADFDAGPDAAALLARASSGAEASPGEPSATQAVRYETDCARLRMRASDPATTPAVALTSREWVRECRPVGDPRRGGRWECWERPGAVHHEWVRITVRDRKPLLPWESDLFRACLQGPWLSLQALATSYEYRHAERPWRGDFVLSPGEKRALAPDPAGLRALALSPGLVLSLKDAWASYYGGERTSLRVVVRQELRGWPDPEVAELRLEEPTRELRELSLLAADWSEPPVPGERYYAELRFRRLGKVSTDSWVRAADSPRAVFAPASSAAAAR